MIVQIAVVVVWTSQVEGMDERGARIREKKLCDVKRLTEVAGFVWTALRCR
jgi:hypothetical protein